ncbi:hypothetical protein [Acinetobacter soli]|uniref:hypothetical protein n=1 Tax=Acinetobacter soli TaxID=487316 RepID=UPI00259107AA|nr:hypothetical protein [uncultured Acinetobacter sp.]
MVIFDKIYSDSFYLLTFSDEKLYPCMMMKRDRKVLSFRVGCSGNARTLNHPNPKLRLEEVTEKEMFDLVINQHYFTRFEIYKSDKTQKNFRSIKSKDVKTVVIHPAWLHLKK